MDKTKTTPMHPATKEVPNFEEKALVVNQLREKLKTEIEPLVQKAIELGLAIEIQTQPLTFVGLIGQKSEITFHASESLHY
jgi:hypothetical protein